MPIAPLRSVCPHCEARLTLKDGGLVGKRIKCPKCQQPFVVELFEEAVAEEAPRKSKVPSRLKNDENGISRPPKKNRTDDEDQEEDEPRARKNRDEDEDRPKKKKKKKNAKKASGPPWVWIGGGVGALAIVAVVLFLVFRKEKDKDEEKKEGDGTSLVKNGPENSNTAINQGDGQSKQATKNENKSTGTVVPIYPELEGPWLDPGPFVNSNPDPATVVEFHIFLAGDSWKVNKMVFASEEAIRDRLTSIISPNKSVARVGTSDDAPSGNGRMITERYGGIQEAPSVLAKRINFGTVVAVEGQIITMVVKKSEVPPPTPKKK